MQYTSRKQTSRKPFTPAQQLQAAIKNAQENGVHVLGQGTYTADGARFFIVPSQSVPGMCHIVKLGAKGLECDCFYSAQRGRVCAHRAATYLHLKALAEAAKKPAPAPAAPAKTMAQRAAEALPADQGEFSIYKTSERRPRGQAAEAEQYTPRDYAGHEYR